MELRLNRRRIAIPIPIAIAIAVGGAVAVSSAGTSGARVAVQDPAPIAVEVLSRHAAFPDDVSVQVQRKLPGQGADVLNLKDAGHVLTARLVIQPGAAFPWHTHPGPVIITVTQGDLVYQAGIGLRRAQLRGPGGPRGSGYEGPHRLEPE
jgi:anti-sigma factor ChrR (cupin superfamily)